MKSVEKVAVKLTLLKRIKQRGDKAYISVTFKANLFYN